MLVNAKNITLRQRRTSRSSAVILLITLFAGCGKVQEMAQSASDAAKEAVGKAPAPAVKNGDTQGASATVSLQPKTDPRQALAEFHAISRDQINDQHLARLAGLG